MNAMLAVLGLSGGELVLVLVVILVLFGAKRIPEFAKGLGKGINEFKKASREVTGIPRSRAASMIRSAPLPRERPTVVRPAGEGNGAATEMRALTLTLVCRDWGTKGGPRVGPAVRHDPRATKMRSRESKVAGPIPPVHPEQLLGLNARIRKAGRRRRDPR